MDIVPCYIKIFDKYDNCRRFVLHSCGKSEKELNGYFSIAILCYEAALEQHKEIANNISKKISEFYEILKVRLGGDVKIRENA